VHLINRSISIDNATFFGIAQTVLRGQEKLPAVVYANGKADYVGIDDVDAVRAYHKLATLTVRPSPANNYGRGSGFINAYSMQLIVFLNRNKKCMHADSLVQILQSQFPEQLKLKPYSGIQIFFNSVILNDLQVYNQEYLSETNRLGPEHNLFQVNYTVEATFLKGCLNTEQTTC
jgi:hypothetical protein